jgi:hypothetical protein
VRLYFPNDNSCVYVYYAGGFRWIGLWPGYDSDEWIEVVW